MIQTTTFTKSGGPLTKHIGLNADGTLQNDSSACRMSAGSACRSSFANLQEFADHLVNLGSDQAIALGRLIESLPDQVDITTKDKLDGHPERVARTATFLHYAKGEPALLLLDHDDKEMPSTVCERVAKAGGFPKRWPRCCPHQA
jgi:hypothetical protein